MKENKNIERLFQEKFKDFEAAPPDGAWNNIASKLQEKKKKKSVIPFWFKASGIAASLFIGLFLLLNNQSNSIKQDTNNAVVIENKVQKTGTEKTTNAINSEQKESSVVLNDDIQNIRINNQEESTIKNSNSIQKQKIISNKTVIVVVHDDSNNSSQKKSNIKEIDVIKINSIKNKKNSFVKNDALVTRSNEKNLVNPMGSTITNQTTEVQVLLNKTDFNSNSTSNKIIAEANSSNKNEVTHEVKNINATKNNTSNEIITEVNSSSNTEVGNRLEKNTISNETIAEVNSSSNSKVIHKLEIIDATKNNTSNEIITEVNSSVNTAVGNRLENNTISNETIAEVNSLGKTEVINELEKNTINKNTISTQNDVIGEKKSNSKNLTEKSVIDNNTILTQKIDNANKETPIVKTEDNITSKPIYSFKNGNSLIKDSTIVITQVEPEVNALEQLLKEKEEGKNADEKEKEKRSKWAISSNAAPVYFNSISNGSPIDDQFIENPKSYATSLSYGVGLQYALSKKISIRSGVNSIAVNYDTNDIFYTNSLSKVNATSMNVSRNQNAENLILKNARFTDESQSISSDIENFSNGQNIASLNQKMGFLEVPLELSYKIIDKKFGIEFIGGMSTLFLNTNSVALVSNGSEMIIGEATNLNNIHFSSNVGLGFKYTFWKSLNANFQPMFKYQINTFNEDSGNFKPYIIGLYSGISFNF